MFDKLLNEKNRYLLVNVLFSLILILVFLLLIALLKDSALNFISLFFNGVFKNTILAIIVIVITCIYIGYLIYYYLNNKIIIKGSVVYLTLLINLVQVFNLDLVKFCFSKLFNKESLFLNKFFFIVLYLVLKLN